MHTRHKSKNVDVLLVGFAHCLQRNIIDNVLEEVTAFADRGMEFQAVAAVAIGGTCLFGARQYVARHLCGCVITGYNQQRIR